MQFGPLAEYICSKCGSILGQTDVLVNAASIEETCPNCNSYLADTLVQNARQKPEARFRPKLQTAFDLTKFRLDIPGIDSKLQLATTGSICISGYMANKVLTRLFVRAIMSAKYGGLDSAYVIVVDAGNKSDFYQTVNFAKQYGLDIKSSLDRIIVSRTFTINQLKSIIVKELPKVLNAYQARMVAIPGLLDLFEDPNIKEKEAKRLIADILKSLDRLAAKVLIATTIAPGAYSEPAMQSFQKRIILGKPDRQKLTAEIHEGSKLQKVTVTERELNIVPRA